jgi:hypothetical protein
MDLSKIRNFEKESVLKALEQAEKKLRDTKIL